MVKSLTALVAAAFVMQVPALEAHPLHTSYTEIARDRSGRLMISIRVFSDDLSSVLGAPGDSVDAAVRGYVARVLTLQSSGAPVSLVWCGVKRQGNQVLICAASSEAIRGKVRVRNALLLERFADQVNIVRWTTPSSTRTVVMTQRVVEVALE